MPFHPTQQRAAKSRYCGGTRIRSEGHAPVPNICHQAPVCTTTPHDWLVLDCIGTDETVAVNVHCSARLFSSNPWDHTQSSFCSAHASTFQRCCGRLPDRCGNKMAQLFPLMGTAAGCPVGRHGLHGHRGNVLVQQMMHNLWCKSVDEAIDWGHRSNDPHPGVDVKRCRKYTDTPCELHVGPWMGILMIQRLRLASSISKREVTILSQWRSVYPSRSLLILVLPTFRTAGSTAYTDSKHRKNISARRKPPARMGE